MGSLLERLLLMKINIAIDGPSASGKSTIAKRLAAKLNYTHLDTGAMYRAVAYNACLLNIDIKDEKSIMEMLEKTRFSFAEKGRILSNGIDISEKIRTKEIDLLASAVSKLPLVRQNLVSQQQLIAKDKGYILDGRDIGSVVLPDAEVKIYQTASIESRAKRRLLDYENKGLRFDYQTIFEEIKQRDYQDSHREHSPLIKTDDAIEIDTSDLSIEDTVQIIMDLVTKAINRRQHD